MNFHHLFYVPTFSLEKDIYRCVWKDGGISYQQYLHMRHVLYFLSVINATLLFFCVLCLNIRKEESVQDAQRITLGLKSFRYLWSRKTARFVCVTHLLQFWTHDVRRCVSMAVALSREML